MESIAIFEVIAISIYLILSISIIFLNRWFMTALVKKTLLHTPSNAVLGSLSCSDMIIGIVSCFQVLILLMRKYGHTYSTIHLALFNTLLVLIGLSCIFITLVNLDRYFAICHPYKYLQYATLKLFVIISISSCLLCSLVIIAALVMDSVFRSYSAGVIFIIISCAVSSILICCNWKILRVIHRQRREIASVRIIADLDESRFQNETKRYRIIVLLVIIFIICKLPPSACYLLPFILEGQPTISMKIFSNLSDILLLLNSFLNPLVYYCNISLFRNAMKEVLCCHRLT